MIQKYIIDGNNLIGKIKELWALQQKDKQMARVKLVKKLDYFFNGKNVRVSLHLDGFTGDAIPSSSCKLYYSNNNTADSQIKQEIDLSNNPKNVAVVSSDHSVQNYGKVSSCKIIKSEDFGKLLLQKKITDQEDEITKSISNDDVKKMFGI